MYIKLAIKHFSFLMLLGIICPIILKAQQKYNFERINTENGLPANTIKGIQFDSINRFLWLGTESGLVRYNGHNFQTFGDNDFTNKLNGRIVSLNRKEDGSIFGRLMNESVFYILGNRPIIASSKVKINFNDTYLNYKYDLPIENNNRQQMGCSFVDFKVKEKYYTFLEFPTSSIFYKYNFGRFDSLTFFQNRVQGFSLQDRLFILDENGFIKELVAENKGTLVFNKIHSFGLLSLKKHKLHNQFKVFQNGKNEVYLLNENSLYRIVIGNKGIEFQLITDELPNKEFIHYMQMDKVTNTIYLGTDNRGLLVGHPIYFKRVLPIDYKDGNSSAVYTQVLLPNGNIQVNSGQLFGNSTNKNTNIFYRHAATSTYITSEHHLLMTNADGIIEYDLTNNRIVSISNEINVDRNSFIQVDSTIYSFNLKGVATKQMHSGWSMKLHFKKVPADFMTYQCAVVNKNTILVTTSDGLYEYNISNNSFKRIFRDKTGANFRAIYNLRGYFLIGTYGGGVYMYKDGIIKHLPLDPNKFLEFTHCFIKDDQDHIFASTNKGLFMSTASSLIDFWDKGPGNIAYNYFGKLEGIDVLEMNGGCDPCAIRLKNGNISIPGIDGLIQFDPNYLPDLKIMPTAFLDKILINNIPFSPNILNQHLASDVKFIEFQFGVSGMLSQEDFLFEYKFDDDPWVRIGILNSNSNINIGNPGYGAHKLILRIRKSNIPKWKISTFKFYVEFPWFLHPTMFFIYFIIFSSLLYLYIKLRVVLYRRKQIELEGEIFNKTVSLRKLNASLAKRNQAKDQVIAIMNHDILTPLKYLHITSSNIVDQIQDANIKKSIEQISSTTKELEYQTSNMLNWVKFESLEKLPKKQSVDLHILVNNLIEFVEPFKQNNQVYLLNNIPPNCIVQSWPEQLRVLLYNIVMNALRSTTQGEIAMSATSNSNGFTMTVSDTGIGMSKSMANYLIIGYSKDEVENLPKHKTGNGVGYQIIRSILMLMKATIEIDSVEGKGTTVKLFFNQL